MVAKVSDLVKNPNFLLKIIELILVSSGFVFVVLQDPFAWANSVTMIFYIDTGTYFVILIVILLAYALEQPHQLIELSFTVIGIGVFVIGSILAFINHAKAQEFDDEESSKLDLRLGIILSVTTVAMIIDTILNTRRLIRDGLTSG